MYGKSGNRKRFQGFPYFLAKQCGKFREINQTGGGIDMLQTKKLLALALVLAALISVATIAYENYI